MLPWTIRISKMFSKIVLLDFPKVNGISQLPQLREDPWIALPADTQAGESAVGAPGAAGGPGFSSLVWAVEPWPHMGSPCPSPAFSQAPPSLRNQHVPDYSALKPAEILFSSFPALSLGFLFFRKQDIEEVQKGGPDLCLIWYLQLLISIFRCSLRIFYPVPLSLEVHIMVGLTLKISMYREVFWKLQF